MAWIERLRDAALTAADRLHIFRRSQLDEWEHIQHEAKGEVERIRDLNARDIEAMSPEEKRKIDNRLEQAYQHRNGGRAS